MKSLRPLVAIGLAAFAPAAPVAAASLADSHSSFFVFGDSLSDAGNLYAATGGAVPASPPYYAGRYSNGPVWAEHVTGKFAAAGKAGVNLAYAGATAVTNDDAIPDLDRQIAIASTLGALKGDTPLAAVWFGANDVLNALPTLSAPTVVAAATAAAENVLAAITTLGRQGFGDVAVFTLPDLGKTPRFSLLIPQIAPLASAGIDAFNARLLAGLGTLAGPTVTLVDAGGLFDQLMTDPAAFGIADVTLPCVFPSAEAAAGLGQPEVCSAATALDRAFFDTIHPNSVVQEALARSFEEAVTPVPLPAALPVFGLVLGAGALFGRPRRRRSVRDDAMSQI